MAPRPASLRALPLPHAAAAPPTARGVSRRPSWPRTRRLARRTPPSRRAPRPFCAPASVCAREAAKTAPRMQRRRVQARVRRMTGATATGGRRARSATTSRTAYRGSAHSRTTQTRYAPPPGRLTSFDQFPSRDTPRGWAPLAASRATRRATDAARGRRGTDRARGVCGAGHVTAGCVVQVTETAVLASIRAPRITHRLRLPRGTIEEGRLTNVQLESIFYACQQARARARSAPAEETTPCEDPAWPCSAGRSRASGRARAARALPRRRAAPRLLHGRRPRRGQGQAGGWDRVRELPSRAPQGASRCPFSRAHADSPRRAGVRPGRRDPSPDHLVSRDCCQ